MKIKTISAKNFANSSFEQPLGDVTLFCGRNFVGKSTRVNVLALALCQKLPGIARPGDVYREFATGNPLQVCAEADDGRYSGVVLEADRKGKVSLTAEGDLAAPLLLFDTSEFLDLSPKDRTRFLFGVLPPPPLDKVGPDAIVARLKNIKCDPHTEAHETAVNDFANLVREHYELGKSNLAEEFTIQDWLAELVDLIAGVTKESVAAAKTMRQTALGTVALRKDAPALGPVEAAKVRAHDAHMEAVRAESKALSEFTAAERAVQECKALAGKMVDETLVRAKVFELEQCIAKARLVPAAGDKPGFRVMTVRPTDTKQRDTLRVLTAAADATNRAKKDAEAKMERLESDIVAAKAQTTCPTCGHDITENQKTIVSDLKKRLKEAKETVESATAAHQKNVQSEAEGVEALNMATAAIQYWDRQKQQADKENAADMDAWNAKNTAYNQAQHRANEYVAEIQRLEASVAANATAREAQVKLPSLEQVSQAYCVRFNDALNTTRTAQQAAEKADTDHRAAVADAASARQAQQAAEKAEESEAKAAVGQELRGLLDALLRECVKLSISPLVDLCNDLCRGILPGDMAFVDGEVVILGRGPSHKSMSGTEKALLYCALSVGLAAQSPVKLVILDEIGRLSDENKVRLANRLGRLIAEKKINQAILVDTRRLDGWEMPEGVEFVQVEVVR